MFVISFDLMKQNIDQQHCQQLLFKNTLLLGLWVGWPGLDLNEMKNETVPESDPEDTSPTAGLK